VAKDVVKKIEERKNAMQRINSGEPEAAIVQ